MSKFFFNLFENEIIQAYIDLQYEKSVITSYSGRVIVRDLYLSYKLKFHHFVQLIHKNQAFSLIENLDNLVLKERPDTSKLESVPWTPPIYREQDYNELLLTAPSTIKNLELERTISYPYLKSQYSQKYSASNADVFKTQLNSDFLTAFSKFYGQITFSSIIELWLDILIYEKEFDGVLNIEFFLFEDVFRPNKHLLNQSINLFLKLVTCYYYLKDIQKGKGLLENLYKYMDENFDTGYKQSEHQQEIRSEREIPDGCIMQSDRRHYNQRLSDLSPKWTFSSLIQVKNAFRLNLIDERNYFKALSRIEQKNNLKSLNVEKFNELLKSSKFLDLIEEQQIAPLVDPHEKRIYPSVYFFDDLKFEQLAEYKAAFSQHATYHSINKYIGIRVKQLEKAFENFEYSAEEIFRELDLISIINKNESLDPLIENIRALEFLRRPINSKILQKINAIRLLLKGDTRCIYVIYEHVYYRFYRVLEYRDALNFNEAVLDIALNGGNTDEQAWYKWYKEENNDAINALALELNDKKYQNENSTLKRTEKEEALDLIYHLENDCSVFMAAFYAKVKPKNFIIFIGKPISKLIKAYIKTKNFEKGIYWADECFAVISRYSLEKPGCTLSEIQKLKEKCLRSMLTSDNSFEKNKKVKFELYEESRNFVRSLGLKSENEWREYKKTGAKPPYIPADPESVYKGNGWKGFQDWLGYDKSEMSVFQQFEDARHFVRSLGLKSESEWREYKKTGLKPSFIPGKPEKVYKDKGWLGFQNWLGYNR